jgi:hypothetical protein
VYLKRSAEVILGFRRALDVQLIYEIPCGESDIDRLSDVHLLAALFIQHNDADVWGAHDYYVQTTCRRSREPCRHLKPELAGEKRPCGLELLSYGQPARRVHQDVRSWRNLFRGRDRLEDAHIGVIGSAGTAFIVGSG